MKKYLKLTSKEAIQYFIHKDGTLVPEKNEEIGYKLNDLDKLKNGMSVSIVMPTNRIFPDTENDKGLLKNLISETEIKLHSILDKRKVKKIMENIEEAAEMIDVRLNLDSLVLYANEYFSSVVKLPITLKPEIIIDPYFDIRPLYKAQQQNQHYYILTVSRQKIRLLEAFNDKLVEEFNNNDFPFKNVSYYTTDPIKLDQDSFEENLIKEFFNVADKNFRKYLINNPLPIVLAGDVKSVSYYKGMMDDSQTVIAYISGSYDETPVHEILSAIYPLIEQYHKNLQVEYLREIDNAKSNGLLSTDINEMYVFALSGNAKTLFIGNNCEMEGIVDGESLSLSIENTENSELKKRSLTLLLIEYVRKEGGQIIFLDDDLLEKYNGLLLVKRF